MHAFTKPLRALYLIGDLSSARLVGIATVAVLLVAAFVALAILWSTWDGRDVARFFARREDYATTSPLGGRQFALFVGSLILLLAVAIFIGVTGDYAAVWNFARDHVIWSLVIVAALGVVLLVVSLVSRPLARRVENALVARFVSVSG